MNAVCFQFERAICIRRQWTAGEHCVNHTGIDSDGAGSWIVRHTHLIYQSSLYLILFMEKMLSYSTLPMNPSWKRWKLNGLQAIWRLRLQTDANQNRNQGEAKQECGQKKKTRIQSWTGRCPHEKMPGTKKQNPCCRLFKTTVCNFNLFKFQLS